MLVSFEHIPSDLANATVDLVCKSIEEGMADDPHPTDRLIGAMEDATTLPVKRCLLGLYDAVLAALVTGNPHLRKARQVAWLPAETKCQQLELRMAKVAAGTMTFTDYLDVIDCLLLRYLPNPILQNQVQGQVVKQYLTGHLRAKGIETVNPTLTVAALPTVMDLAANIWAGFTSYDHAVVAAAQANAGRLVTDLSSITRSKLAKIVIDAERRRLNDGTAGLSPAPLTQQLADTFGELNRDWRRIAITETAINQADGYLASVPMGSLVRWVSHPAACDYCDSLNGQVFRIVKADTPRKDYQTEIWVGKQILNVGRSIAKRKRLDDGTMVDRDEDERVVPAQPAHPSCRCVWVPSVKETDALSARNRGMPV